MVCSVHFSMFIHHRSGDEASKTGTDQREKEEFPVSVGIKLACSTPLDPKQRCTGCELG